MMIASKEHHKMKMMRTKIKIQMLKMKTRKTTMMVKNFSKWKSKCFKLTGS